MISASTLSCYSTHSSHIPTMNHLITFLMLLSRYPVLQSINTYYSLIRAVYVFRLCALFSPRISSPSLYWYDLHVFPISRNCLAPPHSPEFPHRAFIPQCIYSPHSAFSPCEFVLLTIFLSILVLCLSLLPFKSNIILAFISSSCSCHLFHLIL